MALLPILKFPDPRLRTIAKPITTFNDHLAQLIQDMLETMYKAPGIGLAATQVNQHIQLVVMDLSEQKNTPQIFINPKLTILTEELSPHTEGCLSVPDVNDEVFRPNKVQIDALNENGKPFTLLAESLLAVCIQHECDHLNGKLFIDYLSNLKRQRIKKKLTKIQKLSA